MVEYVLIITMFFAEGLGTAGASHSITFYSQQECETARVGVIKSASQRRYVRATCVKRTVNK